MKRAVLIGIDRYDNFAPLDGCVADVKALAPLLANHADGDPNFDIQAWTSDHDKIDRTTMLTAVDFAFRPGADLALLFFAGHGASARNDVVLASKDGVPGNAGVALSEILGAVQASPVAEIIIMLDCCFSGGAGGAPQLGNNVAVLRPGVTLLTASRADQTSAELGMGQFTYYLCDALRGGAADVLGQVTLASAYAFLSESFGAFEQRPTLKAHIDRLQSLRRCNPVFPLAELRQLSVIFEKQDTHLQLDATFEPTAKVKKKNLENQRILKILQRCRAARLVEPVGFDHLYDAAMQEGNCRLTALGQHYWRLAKRNKLG